MSSKSEDLTLQQRTDRLLGRVAGGPYTPPAPKESISEPPKEPPKKEIEMAESKLDVEKVSDLLNIVDGTRDMPELKVIFDEALRELVEMARELREAAEEETGA